MYIEHLSIPHPNTKSTQTVAPRPVEEVIDFNSIRAELNRAHEISADAYNEAIVGIIPEALGVIGKSLWYSDSDGPDAKTTPLDTLKTSGETHCFGYALLTSEALGRLGIQHWIAAIGQHATTLIPLRLRGYDKLFVVDSLNAAFTGYIHGALWRTTVPVMKQEMADPLHPRGTAKLNLHALPDGYQLLAHGKSAMHGPLVGDEERSRTLVMSTFHVAVGEHALLGTAKYHAAATHGDYQRAAAALRAAPGLYYDIDGRASHDHIKEVVAGLCERDEFAVASQAATDYCDSFARTKHTLLTELRADLLAMAARGGSTETRARALATYRLASQRAQESHTKTRIENKARALAESLHPAA